MRRIIFFKTILIGLVLCIALFARIHKIHDTPSLIDEPAFGYSSYSILKTGRDEFGKTWPLTLKSYGDYKPAGYAYAALLPIQLFGTTDFAVRLPSVLAGVIIVLIMFLLLHELGLSFFISLSGALLAAVSPWTIVLSRYALEMNVALLFFTAGLLFYVRGLKYKRQSNFILSGLLMALTWYFYLPYRPITVFFLLITAAIFVIKKKLLIKQVMPLFIAFFIVTAPLYTTIFAQEGTARFKQSSIFTSHETTRAVNEDRTLCTSTQPKLICYINSNKIISYVTIIFNRYAKTYSLEFLFLQGEPQKFLSVDNFGLLPFFLIPFYLYGFFVLIQQFSRSHKTASLLHILLAAGLIITVFPNAISSDPQRMRLSALFPFLTLLLLYPIHVIKNKKIQQITAITLCCLFIVFGAIYLFNYLNVHIKKHADDRYYRRELSLALGAQAKNTPIYLKSMYGEALTYYSYYNKIDPRLYQKKARYSAPDENGFIHLIELENIHITTESPTSLSCNPTTSFLYVTDKPLNRRPHLEIKSASGVQTLAYVYKITSTGLCKK